MFIKQYRIQCDVPSCCQVFNCLAENKAAANVAAQRAGWGVRNIGKANNLFTHYCPSHRRKG